MRLEGLRRVSDLLEADVRGKRVLLRADLNVPVDSGGCVSDDWRLRAIVPTVYRLRELGGRILLMSHFGRPHGEYVSEYSLYVVRDCLADILGVDIAFAADCVGDEAHLLSERLLDGEVGLLENLRFHTDESENDSAFALSLASLGDIYVNDAFSASHRSHASIDAITDCLPSYAGLSLIDEVANLQQVLLEPASPMALVIGGAKVSTKIKFIEHILDKVDYLIIGGGMANTFLLAQDIGMGCSLVEEEHVGTALRILSAAREKGVDVILPSDAIVADELSEGVSTRLVSVSELTSTDMILDIGSESIEAINGVLDKCATILWNGPLGAFEVAPFGEGSFACMRHAAELTRQGKMRTIGGGGDTVHALKKAGVLDDFSYVSSAGGAFLEFFEGDELAGLKALHKNN